MAVKISQQKLLKNGNVTLQSYSQVMNSQKVISGGILEVKNEHGKTP